jgi:hypothetical protein
MSYQEEWKIFFNVTYTPSEDTLIWFTQCDDHVFIDFNTDILYEGIEHLKNDTSNFKSLYFSHWPEILRLSGKLGNQVKIGNYIKFNATLLDTIQIFNLRYLKYLFLEREWKGKEYKKIDSLILQPNIWSDPMNPYPYGGSLIGDFISDLQTIYVPLRELVRHFDGYSHVGMRTDDGAEFPYLKLPQEDNIFLHSPAEIVRKVNVAHTSPWTDGNKFKIPDEWINHIVYLYSTSPNFHNDRRNFTTKVLPFKLKK